jgi:hypothetical protein
MKQIQENFVSSTCITIAAIAAADAASIGKATLLDVKKPRAAANLREQ